MLRLPILAEFLVRISQYLLSQLFVWGMLGKTPTRPFPKYELHISPLFFHLRIWPQPFEISLRVHNIQHPPVHAITLTIPSPAPHSSCYYIQLLTTYHCNTSFALHNAFVVGDLSIPFSFHLATRLSRFENRFPSLPSAAISTSPLYLLQPLQRNSLYEGHRPLSAFILPKTEENQRNASSCPTRNALKN